MAAMTFSMPREENMVDRIKSIMEKHLKILESIRVEGGEFEQMRTVECQTRMSSAAQEIFDITRFV